jgi:hypothetical protein
MSSQMVVSAMAEKRSTGGSRRPLTRPRSLVYRDPQPGGYSNLRDFHSFFHRCGKLWEENRNHQD